MIDISSSPETHEYQAFIMLKLITYTYTSFTTFDELIHFPQTKGTGRSYYQSRPKLTLTQDDKLSNCAAKLWQIQGWFVSACETIKKLLNQTKNRQKCFQVQKAHFLLPNPSTNKMLLPESTFFGNRFLLKSLFLQKHKQTHP